MGITRYRVISLKGSERIKGFYEQEFAKKFSTYIAFDGRVTRSPSFIDLEKYKNILGRDPLPGEIGASVSHYLLCKEFAEESGNLNDFMLVAEDDARFSKDVGKIINRVVYIAGKTGTGLSILASSNGAGVRDINSVPQRLAVLSILSFIVGWARKFPYIYGNFNGLPICAGLYLISRKSAIKYVDFVEGKNNGLFWPADHYKYWTDPQEVKIKILRPGLADWEGESTIGGEDHTWEEENFISNMRSSIVGNNIFLKLRFNNLRRSFKAILKND